MKTLEQSKRDLRAMMKAELKLNKAWKKAAQAELQFNRAKADLFKALADRDRA